MIPIKAASAWRGTSDCRACGIRELVLFAVRSGMVKLVRGTSDGRERNVRSRCSSRKTCGAGPTASSSWRA